MKLEEAALALHRATRVLTPRPELWPAVVKINDELSITAKDGKEHFWMFSGIDLDIAFVINDHGEVTWWNPKAKPEDRLPLLEKFLAAIRPRVGWDWTPAPPPSRLRRAWRRLRRRLSNAWRGLLQD
ncbi:MAG: hypothetical protein PHT12_02495 [Patescibacteria group bacterium]|nr:hypothetical protein [Patescibacteria group bacterium]